MTNYCSKTIQVDDSLLIALTTPENLPGDRDRDFIHCDLELQAPEGKKLFAHFLQLGISPAMDHSDRLHLYDVTPNNTRLTPIKGLYGKLDRPLALFDNSGIQVQDYRTSSEKLKVDYLGKPTMKSPGFRLLITNFQDPNYGGECLVKHFLCKQSWMCIPRHVTCDGNPNCGKDDASDEKGCDRFDTVTNLLAEYSLARDIIVAILLPLVIFISVVIVIFIVAQRYIRNKINKPALPTIHFNPRRDGEVRIVGKDAMYAPPAYEDLEMPRRYEPPPAYTGLSYSPVKDSGNAADSDIQTATSNSDRINNKEGLTPKDILSSMSSNDPVRENLKEHLDSSEYENYRLHCVWPSDTDDDEDIKEKRRRKGGRGKVKGKRKVTKESDRKTDRSSLLAGEATSVDKSDSSVPSCDSAIVYSTADSSSPSASSPDLPPSSHSVSLETSFTRPAITNHQQKQLPSRTSEGFISIHTNPGKSTFPLMPFDSDITAACERSDTPDYADLKCRKTRTSMSDDRANQRVSSKVERSADGEQILTKDINNGDKINKHGKVFHKTKATIHTAGDDDTDVSGDSDSGQFEIDEQKGKVTLHLTKNQKGTGKIAVVK